MAKKKGRLFGWAISSELKEEDMAVYRLKVAIKKVRILRT